MDEKKASLDQKIKQMRKGVLELAILKILSQQEGYGYNIVERLKEHSIIIAEGTVYPILSRLKKEEAISYRWEESTKGPPRKYFFITPEGIEQLQVLSDEFTSFYTKISEILGENK